MTDKTDTSGVELSVFSQLEKDYNVLYRALELILEETYVPYTMKRIAESALDKVTIKP